MGASGCARTIPLFIATHASSVGSDLAAHRTLTLEHQPKSLFSMGGLTYASYGGGLGFVIVGLCEQHEISKIATLTGI